MLGASSVDRFSKNSDLTAILQETPSNRAPVRTIDRAQSASCPPARLEDETERAAIKIQRAYRKHVAETGLMFSSDDGSFRRVIPASVITREVASSALAARVTSMLGGDRQRRRSVCVGLEAAVLEGLLAHLFDARPLELEPQHILPAFAFADYHGIEPLRGRIARQIWRDPEAIRQTLGRPDRGREASALEMAFAGAPWSEIPFSTLESIRALARTVGAESLEKRATEVAGAELSAMLPELWTATQATRFLADQNLSCIASTLRPELGSRLDYLLESARSNNADDDLHLRRLARWLRLSGQELNAKCDWSDYALRSFSVVERIARRGPFSIAINYCLENGASLSTEVVRQFLR